MPSSESSGRPEEWRAVAGYEGTYSVSSMGRVRRERAAQGTRPGAVLRAQSDERGRLYIELSHGGVSTRRKVHQLVAQAFLGPMPPGHEIRHRDGDKRNNAAHNLCYRAIRSALARTSAEPGM